MSTYNGGRMGPNVSRYLQDLNVIQSGEASPEESRFDDDLGMFTNAQFIDWDKSGFETPAKVEQETRKSPVQNDSAASASPAVGNFGMDFTMSDDFSNFDFSTFSNPTVPAFPDNLGSLQPLQPNPAPAYPGAGARHNQFVPAPQAAGKRLSTGGQSRQLSIDEQARLAAEEDKRRRNTAASARFRVKKKAREQALERREKELSEENSKLKNRINVLETENKWLKNLVMEKTGAKDAKLSAKFEAFLKTVGNDADVEDASLKVAESKQDKGKVETK